MRDEAGVVVIDVGYRHCPGETYTENGKIIY